MFDGSGARVTHRVVEVDADRRLLRLKGDVNDVVDPVPYPAADPVDLVLFAVPAGGYVVTWLSSPAAMLLLGGYVVFLLSVLRPRGRPAARHRIGPGVGVALVLGLAVAGTPQPTPTLAAFVDTAPVAGTALAAYTVPKPVLTCSASLVAVTVTWTAVSTPYSLTYQAMVVETGQTLTVNTSGGTRSANTGTLLQSGTRTIRITASPPGVPSWTGPAADQVINIEVLGLVPSCGRRELTPTGTVNAGEPGGEASAMPPPAVIGSLAGTGRWIKNPAVVRLHEFYRDPRAPQAHDLLPAAFAAVRNPAGDVLMVRRIDDGNWELPGWPRRGG